MIQVGSAFRQKVFSAQCRPVELYELYLDNGVRRYSTEHITWDGAEYLPYVVERSEIKRSEKEIDSVTVTFSNVDTSIADLLLTQQIEGRRLAIRLVDRDVPGESVTLFHGIMDRPARIDEQTAQLTAREILGSINAEVPSRVFSPSCPWRFKGEECGYAGPETDCNKSWARCQQLNNTARFGGFRFIPHSGVYQYKQVEKQRTWYTLGLWARKKEKTVTAVFNAVDDVVYDLAIPIVLGRTQITGIPIQHVDEGGQVKVLVAFAAGACAQATYLRANGKVVSDWTFHSGQFGNEGSQTPDPRFPGAYPYSLLCYAGVTIPSEVTQEDPAPAIDCVLLGSIVAVFDEQGALVTTVWTDNPIWNIRHLLTMPLAQGGMGFPFEWIDDAHLAREAAYCEELITDVTGSQMIVVPSDAPVTPGDDYRRYQSTGVDGIVEYEDGPYVNYEPSLDLTPPTPKLIKRFTLNVAIAKQEKALDVLQRKLFPACRAFRRYNKDGKLQICIEKPEPSAALTGSVTAGSVALPVDVTSGVAAGDLILLSPFTAEAETAQISSVAGSNLMLAAPLQYAHSSGAQLHRIAMVFDDSSIVGDLEYPLADRQPSYNRVTIKYVDAPSGFEPRELRINDYEHQDQVHRVENLEVDGSAIDNYNQAWRIGQWIRAKARDLGRYITFRTDLRAALLEIGDVVAVSAGEVGLQAVPFRVIEITLLESDEVLITGQVYALGVYSDEAPQSTLTIPTIFRPQTSVIPPIQNLQATEVELLTDTEQVRIVLSGTAPDFPDLAEFRIYVEVPNETDPDPANPTLPGQVFFTGAHFSEPNKPVSMELLLPFPPLAWLQSKKVPNQPLLVKWVLYAVTASWDASAPLVRLTQLSPPAPADASPWVSVSLDFTSYVEERAGGYVMPVLRADFTTLELVGDQIKVRAGWHPVWPSVGIEGVDCYTSANWDRQNRPHGYFPYEGDLQASPPNNLGWVEARLDRPATLPQKLVIQIVPRWMDGFDSGGPTKITWLDAPQGTKQAGDPLTVPNPNALELTVTDALLALTAPVVDSVQVETRQQTDGSWTYRLAITLSGAVLQNPRYGRTDIHVLFDGETDPWETARVVATHLPGDAATVYSGWYEIRPGTTAQFNVRPEARDVDGVVQVWGDISRSLKKAPEQDTSELFDASLLV